MLNRKWQESHRRPRLCSCHLNIGLYIPCSPWVSEYSLLKEIKAKIYQRLVTLIRKYYTVTSHKSLSVKVKISEH